MCLTIALIALGTGIGALLLVRALVCPVSWLPAFVAVARFLRWAAADAGFVLHQSENFCSSDGSIHLNGKEITGLSDKALLDDKLPIIPGMVAQVDILTGKKSVLAYLLKPVLRAKANALTER